jgi:predicted MFS family arabinose efflux permease
MLMPPDWSVIAILAVWALATLPQTIVAICFSVVMNAVAGPHGRFELMSRRWSILGITTFISVLMIGQILRANESDFPRNYQAAFIALSIGGLISFYFSSHIKLPPTQARIEEHGQTLRQRVGEYLGLIRSQPAFTSFLYKRFVFLSGISMAAPLFPLYFVKEVQANDGWIGVFTGAQTMVLVIGYWLWTRQSRRHGNRRVLLWTTAGLGLYPILVALTHQPSLIAIYAGLAGIFQAGQDLVFFDELMKTVPAEYSATFISFAQSVQYISSILSPLIGTLIGDSIGLGPALIVAGGLRLIGFLLFFFDRPHAKPTASVAG